MAGYDDQFYASQPDLAANNFSNSPNRAMLNNGWGMDPNLLTPSYTSSYRPPWAGNGPTSNYSQPGFFRGAANLMPWQSYGHTAPQDNWDRNISGVVNSPVNAAAFVVQRIAAPALAFHVAGKLVGPRSFSGVFTGQGAGASLGKTMASGFATGVGRGMGLGAVGAGRIGAAAGVAGSVVGSFAAPYAVGMAGMEGVERAFINPFINNAKTADSLRENFSGVTFGDASGNHFTGRGLGRSEAMNMAQSITQGGIKDRMFSTKEYRDISDMSARSGMLDNTKASDITGKIKDIAEQVKLIIAISKDPNIQGAIESLSKLQVSGASGKTASSVYSHLGMKASVAGSSIQKMMDTVGAQGEYLFRQNGMTGYQGQVSAANSYSSFAAANRMGIISPEQLARMGGLDGATQASLTGQVNASQTMFNKMKLYNENFGGGSRKDLVSGITQFGSSMASDPLKVMGGGLLYGRQMAGNDIQKNGAKGIEEQMMMYARLMPGAVKNGKIEPEIAAMILQSRMGMNEDQIHAFMSNRVADTNSGTIDLARKGSSNFFRDQRRARMDQENAYTSYTGKKWGALTREGSSLTGDIARTIVNPINSSMAELGDYATKKVGDLWYGEEENASSDQHLREFAELNEPGSKNNINKKILNTDIKDGFVRGLSKDIGAAFSGWGGAAARDKVTRQTDAEVALMKKLNNSNDPKAIAAVAAIARGDRSSPAIREGINSIINSDKDYSGQFSKREDMAHLLATISGAELSDRPVQDGDKGVTRTLGGEIDRITGLTGGDKNIGVISDIQSLYADGITNTNMGDDKFKARMDRLSSTFGITNQEDLLEKIHGIEVTSGDLTGVSSKVASFMDGSRKLSDKDLARQFNAIRGNSEDAKNARRKIAEKQAAMDADGKVFNTGMSSSDDAVTIKNINDGLAQSNMEADLAGKSQSDINLDSYTKSTATLDTAANTMLTAAKLIASSQGIEVDEKGNKIPGLFSRAVQKLVN